MEPSKLAAEAAKEIDDHVRDYYSGTNEYPLVERIIQDTIEKATVDVLKTLKLLPEYYQPEPRATGDTGAEEWTVEYVRNLYRAHTHSNDAFRAIMESHNAALSQRLTPATASEPQDDTERLAYIVKHGAIPLIQRLAGLLELSSDRLACDKTVDELNAAMPPK